jgi:hypothetical protein
MWRPGSRFLLFNQRLVWLRQTDFDDAPSPAVLTNQPGRFGVLLRETLAFLLGFLPGHAEKGMPTWLLCCFSSKRRYG